jgi:hypothetical protein
VSRRLTAVLAAAIGVWSAFCFSISTGAAGPSAKISSKECRVQECKKLSFWLQDCGDCDLSNNGNSYKWCFDADASKTCSIPDISVFGWCWGVCKNDPKISCWMKREICDK